ncbi:MAG: TraM recognition domain-containing protein [Candidatus Muirbacterium halophilum]|nr:TraM recognition domain-containing protein [Candidatus Muirbacterium halophilum]
MAIVKSNEKIYKVKHSSYKETLESNRSFVVLIVLLSSIIGMLSYINIVFFNNISDLTARSFVLSCLIIITMGILYILSVNNSLQKFTVIQENLPTNKYHLSFGKEVKQFLGSGIKSLKEHNLTGRYVLLDPEIIKRMGAVIGTTGSGKTVQLKGLLEQQISLGGGACCVDAKGTLDELKNVYAMVGKYGRLKEFYILNFANPNNSHSLNILNKGNVLMLKEMLSELIDRSDPFWDGVAINVVTNILKLLVYKRDYEGFNLTFRDLNSYLNLTKLAEEAKAYKHLIKTQEGKNQYKDIDDFVKYICISCAIDYDKFVNYYDGQLDEDHKPVEDVDAMLIKNSTNSEGIQGVYNFSTGTNRWNEIFTTLGSNYGKIFNSVDADIDLFEVVQSNKLLWIVLPTMESDATARKIGKLILGLIKTVADKKIKRSFEPKIPFLFLLDEFGSFGVVGFGRFMSKARSLGMATWLYFQSEAQLDFIDDGKGLEKKEILDMCNTLIVMKNEDEELAERLSKKVPEEVTLEHFASRTLDRISLESRKKDHDQDKINYQIDKRQAFRSSNFSKLKDGEMMLFIGGDYYKCVAQAQTDFNLTYQKLNPVVNFVLTKSYPKKMLVKDLMKNYHFFDDNLFYLR